MNSPLLTVTELAAHLKISPWTIYGWVSKKFVPHFKLRGAVRFRAEEVEKWLRKNSVPGRSSHRLGIEEGMEV